MDAPSGRSAAGGEQVIRGRRGRVAPPGDAPDHFDLLYYMHCLAWIEQCEQDCARHWQAIGRVVRWLAIVLVLVPLLLGCHWIVRSPDAPVKPHVAPPMMAPGLPWPSLLPTPTPESESE